jgi:hypothetical protein
MTGPLDPISRALNARRHRRRAGDPAANDLDHDYEGTTLPVPVGVASKVEPPPSSSGRPEVSAFAAHLIAQDNRRRGLRGGQPVLDEARSSYLGAEYSGHADRRPRPGRVTKTEI